MRKYFPTYEEAVSRIWLCNCSILNFLIYEKNLIFFFISAQSRVSQLDPGGPNQMNWQGRSQGGHAGLHLLWDSSHLSSQWVGVYKTSVLLARSSWASRIATSVENNAKKVHRELALLATLMKQNKKRAIRAEVFWTPQTGMFPKRSSFSKSNDLSTSYSCPAGPVLIQWTNRK